MTDRRDTKFFLFRLIRPESQLTRDEPSMLTKILTITVIFFLIIDLVIVVFYVKTNRRLEALRTDNYTQVLVNAIEESTSRHADYAKKTMKTMMSDRENMRNFINDLQFFSRDIERIDLDQLTLASLEELKIACENFDTDTNDVKIDQLNDVISAYAKVETEIRAVNDLLMPIDLYTENEQSIGVSEDNIYRNLDQHLITFLSHLKHLDIVHTEYQAGLANEISNSIEKFGDTFSRIYHKHKFVRVIDFFSDQFNQFNKSFLSFNEPYGPYFGTQLTPNNRFTMKRKSRLFYCVIQIYASSINTFNVMLQFVDARGGSGVENEVVLFESYKIKGGANNPVSYNEVKVFELGPGKHDIYLRVVSTGGASQLQFSAMRFECLAFKVVN